MVTQFSLEDASAEAIKGLVDDHSFRECRSQASAVLIQVFSASTDESNIRSVVAELKSALPEAIIVGATTVGEIVAGHSLTGTCAIGITLFQQSTLTLLHQHVEQDCEFLTGQLLGSELHSINAEVKGVLLLATPLSINASKLLAGIEKTEPQYRLFGGGAGDYAQMNASLVLADDTLYQQGVVAVAMSGAQLNIDCRTYLGWKSLVKSMTVTASDGLVVATIDGQPAFEVYRKYLNIHDDEQFFLNALEFPFLLQRNGQELARVPIGVTDNGGLIFVADVFQGETLKLGYGDPELIIEGAKQTLEQINRVNPEAILLYSCGCRRFLMQQQVELETLPLQRIAPTFGFYTYGEFYANDQGQLPLLNSTLVAVALSEGQSARPPLSASELELLEQEQDPYAHRHSRIVSRLVQFISATTEELEQANLAKNQFLANTSHELRTPLTSISGYAEAIINGDIAPSGVNKAADIILQQSSHLKSLIEDILDISKIEAHKLKIVNSSFNLRQLLQGLAESLEPQAKQKGLLFNLQIAHSVPTWISTDQERTYQILLNLCANALKFTSVGSVSLVVSYLSGKHQLLFKVKDTGLGITQEQLKLIFQPFHQCNPIPEAVAGTGLGLTISQHLAHLLGGKITVTSEVGVGSSFALNIPIAIAQPQTQAAPTPSQSKAQSGHILVAEDCDENAELFKLLLEKVGYQVSLAKNGQQAVEAAMLHDFDLILMDIQMPVMGGEEALSILLHSTCDCPIIALTANVMAEDVEAYLSQGFNACLPKPISKQQLLANVAQYITPPHHQTSCSSNLDTPSSEQWFQDLKHIAIDNIKRDGDLLAELFCQQNYQEVHKLVHKLKGVAGQFGLNSVQQGCIHFEQQKNADDKQTQLQCLIAEIYNL